MAREQSDGLPLRFYRGDACAPQCKRLGRFDVILDGNCCHCITADADRSAFLANARDLLRPGGIFILLSMCLPVDRAAVAASFAPDVLIGDTIYCPCDRCSRLRRRYLSGKVFPLMPLRRVPHWKRLLAEISRRGFPPSTDEACASRSRKRHQLSLRSGRPVRPAQPRVSLFTRAVLRL